MTEEPGGQVSPEVPASPPAVAESASRRDRILLGAFVAYAALLALAAFAQLTENRAILDLFDLRRLFE